MRAVVWDVSLPRDGSKTFGRIMTEALGADVIKNNGRCATAEELTERLSDYDMILMSCAQWHADEKRSEEESWILRIASKLGDRMIATVHNSLEPGAPDFPPNAPHLPAILRACAVTWTHREEQICSVETGKTVAWPYLPFIRHGREDVGAGVEMPRIGLWSTARVLGWKKVDLPIVQGYRGRYMVAGVSHFTAAPKLLERLIDLGGDWQQDDELTSWQSPWTVKWRDGGGVRYLGPYSDAYDLPWHWATCHYAYQAKKHLEYSTLEALDNGRRCIVPWWTCEGSGYKSLVDYLHPDIAIAETAVLDAILYAEGLGLPSQEDIDHDLALHDPQILVQKLKDALAA